MKRYDFTSCKGGSVDLHINENDGDWVRYEDHLRALEEARNVTSGVVTTSACPFCGEVDSRGLLFHLANDWCEFMGDVLDEHERYQAERREHERKHTTTPLATNRSEGNDGR